MSQKKSIDELTSQLTEKDQQVSEVFVFICFHNSHFLFIH